MKLKENANQIDELKKENLKLKREIEDLRKRYLYSEEKLRKEFDRQDLHEQKLSIETPGIEHDLYSRIVELADEGVWLYDTQGKTLFINKRTTELLGYTLEEMKGISAFELIDEEFREESKPEQLLNGIKEQYQVKFIRKDKSVLWATVILSALHGEDGNVKAFLSLLTDISDQKHTFIALQESENRFRSLVTASSEVLYLMNADWSEMIHLNGQGFLANTESANPNWLHEYIHPDDQAHVKDVIRKAIENKSIFELEHRVRQANGSWGWTFSRAVPILDSKGEIKEWFGAASDFTKRKEAENTIQELLWLSEQRYAELNAVIESIPDAVYIGNLEGITLCNTSALKMLGASSLKDLQERIGELGKKFNVRWPDTGRTLREDELQFTRALNGETVIEDVLATNAQTGKDVYIRAADAPIMMNGEIIGAVAINSDITERVNADEALKRSNEKYELLFNSIEEGFAHYQAIYDENGRLDDLLVLEINPAGAKLSGVKREEQIGKTWKMVWIGIEDSLFDIYREVDQHGHPFAFEHFSGITQRWYNNKIYKIGKDRFAVTFFDITERKQAEDKLRTSEAQLDAFFANSPTILNLVDGNFCYINTDKITPTYYGLDRESIKGKSVPELSRDFMEQTGIVMRRVLDTGEPILDAEFQAKVPERGGEFVYWRTSFFRVPLGNGNWGVGVISFEITDIKSSEQKLRENEQRLKSIFDNAAIGISETDATDHFLDVNNRLCDMLEYTPEELKSKNVYEVTYPDDISQTIEMNKRLHEGKLRMFHYEKRYVKKDGMPVWVNVTASAILDSNGNFLKSVNTIEDITERKHAEEAVRRSEAILEQAGEMANMGAWEIEITNADDVNQNPLYWSEQVYRIFGYEPGSVPVSNDLFLKRVHPDDRQKVTEAVAKALLNKNSYSLEHRILRADGEERIVHEHAEIAYNNLGKPVRITGAVQDITEQKSAENVLYQALHEAEQGRNILTALMEYIPMGITIADAPDVNIRMVSQYGQNLLEKSSNEIAEIPAPEHPSKWGIYRNDGITPAEPQELPLSRATMKGEIVKNEEWYVTRSDGTLIPILCNAAPILDKNKNIIGGVIGWQDIAGLKRIQREMHQRNEELTRFIYTVSHDLKSPLVTIKMFTSYLKEDINNSDKAQYEQDMGYIENAADKMGRLLDDLLQLSRIGRKEESMTEVRLEKVVKDAIDLVAGRIRQYGVKVIYSAPPVLLFGYTQRLLQLYQNLLDNAVKFMREQTDPQIEIGAYPDTSRNNEIVLFVKDNGIGIDPQLQHKLFGLFEKLDPKSEGTGIGLALVKRIVEVHGGKIWVSSKGYGKGTTFYFTLEKTRLVKD